MREKIDDEIIRHFFANNGETLATENFRYPLMSRKPDSEDSLVTRGLEISRFSNQHSEFDEFFNITQTRNLSLADISILSRSQAYSGKMGHRLPLRTGRNTRKIAFVPSKMIGSSTHRPWLRGFFVILFLVLTLGMITPSPLTTVQEVSGGQKEMTRTSLVQADTAPKGTWNRAIAFFENTLSKLLD